MARAVWLHSARDSEVKKEEEERTEAEVEVESSYVDLFGIDSSQ